MLFILWFYFLIISHSELVKRFLLNQSNGLFHLVTKHFYFVEKQILCFSAISVPLFVPAGEKPASTPIGFILPGFCVSKFSCVPHGYKSAANLRSLFMQTEHQQSPSSVPRRNRSAGYHGRLL